ncbi:MAG: porin [Nocardia sp.]|uniref:MspA family porin n=1 Tax=Nocardia sp. TaxID=1821 RepID=UPI0026263632|nr:MspA family porin [Nocardia sp.]MCU1641354.1 porin [Nocardia sp.]
MNILRIPARAAGISAISTAMLLSANVIGSADGVGSLPGGDVGITLSDGTVVHAWLDGESVDVHPSMGATALHRDAWVSGAAHVVLSQGVQSGLMDPGYVVGCQVNISGGEVQDGRTANLNRTGQQVVPSAGATHGANLTLGPGQAKAFHLLDVELPDPYGNDSHLPVNMFKGTDGSVTWADETIGLTGCTGAAQARAFVHVEIRTDTVTSLVTVWGQPFSIG